MKKEKSCGCIILKDDEVLLIGARDHDGKLFWSFPKGHQEEGETDIETAIRETNEEVGLEVKILDEKPIITRYLVPIRNTHKDVLLFMAEPLTSQIKIQEDEVEKAEWVRVDEAGKYFDDYYNDAWQELLKRLKDSGWNITV